MRIGQMSVPENVFLNDLSVYKMFLNDPLQHRRSAGVVPDPFRIHNGNGPLLADTQAIRLCPIHAVFRLRESQFFQTLLEVVPGFQPILF